MPLQFVLSVRNQKKLVDGGNLYILERKTGETAIWKCDQYYKIRCRARVHTLDDEITARILEHNHAGNIARVEAIKVVNAIKEKALATDDSSLNITTQAYEGISDAVAGQLPDVKCIRRNIQNARKGKNVDPPQPSSLEELIMPEEFRFTNSNQPFILFDNEDGPDRIIVFSASRNLQVLSSSVLWYADGTLKKVPSLFSQLYIINGVIDGDVLPLVYVLLARKSEENYCKLLSELKALEKSLDPVTIMTDFERPAIRAFLTAFPDSYQKVCFFHFSQCLFQSIKSNGLQQQYESDADFALKIRMVAAIAFVPVSDVEETFEYLSSHNDYPEEAQPFLDYFEDTWIGRPVHRVGRRPPRFEHDFWNCFESAKEGITKTDRSFEAFYHRFNDLKWGKSQSLWKFLEMLKKEQEKNEVVIDKYFEGREMAPQKKKYKDSASRIQRIVMTHGNVELLQYLREIAHCITF